MQHKSTGERALAVFVDFENLALGFQGRNDRFDIRVVLKRLVEKGKIVAKKAYADWSRFSYYTGALHEAAIELVEIPKRGQTGKNSADIRLCVDAMDLAYSKEHIDTFVVVSGDSDFSPLVSKLKELGKHVIGLGMSTSTSNLLRDNCDEFIYYEDLTQVVAFDALIKTELPDAKRKAFMLLVSAASALRRENREIIHSSTLKETMRRMKPSFNETYHGYRSFSALLEDAHREGLIVIDTDKKSGTYVVTQLAADPSGRGVRPTPSPATPLASTPRPPTSERANAPISNGGPNNGGTNTTLAGSRPPSSEGLASNTSRTPGQESPRPNTADEVGPDGNQGSTSQLAGDAEGRLGDDRPRRRRRGGRGRRRRSASGTGPGQETTQPGAEGLAQGHSEVSDLTQAEVQTPPRQTREAATSRHPPAEPSVPGDAGQAHDIALAGAPAIDAPAAKKPRPRRSRGGTGRRQASAKSEADAKAPASTNPKGDQGPKGEPSND